jgi:hypothetical protein
MYMTYPCNYGTAHRCSTRYLTNRLLKLWKVMFEPSNFIIVSIVLTNMHRLTEHRTT